MYRILTISALIITACVVSATAGSISGKVAAHGVKSPENAVVYIDKIPGKNFNPPQQHPIMNQLKLQFLPHVLPVVAGTTVDFLNSDDVLHNVYSPDACADKFNLGSWPKGKTRSYQFRKAGCEPVLLCNVHPEMEGFVLVLDTPYFAVVSKDGSYSIKDVPPGTYQLKIWHEKLKGAAQSVTVGAGDASVNFTIQK